MPPPLEIPLKEIEYVTNNFDDANLIGEEFLGKNYKGRLSLSGELLDVAVRRLDRSVCLQEIAFEKEISVLSRLKHDNIVSNIGFSYENNEMLIINKRASHGSLSRHLSGSRLTWMKRLRISVGAAHALSYLHNGAGCNASVVHNNINSGTILLDENWEAKLSGFEFSMTIPGGNLDLAHEKLGIGFYKPDVLSIGIVLFELLCGREAFTTKEDNSFQVPLAIFHYENRTLFKMVYPHLFSQMDHLSFNIFAEIAYYCLKGQGLTPNMVWVLERLSKALEVQQMYEDNEHLIVAVKRTLPDHLQLKLKRLKHMRIRFVDILSATEKFASKHCISSGGFGSVYVAELEHVDKSFCYAIEGENESEVPKKQSKVAIKRIINIGDEIAEQGFYAEIEMLTNCNHSNIIPLLGFCDEGPAMILIYEYASNGSLGDYLHNTSRFHNDSWTQRMKFCLDVAKGLNCLHTTQGDRQVIVHRDIKSANILLDGNFEAKIGDFGLSVFLSFNEEHATQYYRSTAGTHVYQDPQYRKDAKLKKQSDIYSFGVVLFEILCGSLAYTPKYTGKNKGLVLVARQHSDNKTIAEIVDPTIKEKTTETIFTSVKGPDQKSLHTFSTIAYRCLAEAQGDRPTMEDVVKELEKALYFEEIRKDIYQVPLKRLQLATNNFGVKNMTDEDRNFWRAYTGEVVSGSNNYATTIDVRRHMRKDKSLPYELGTELKVLMEHKHDNVISLLGYCDEGEEQIVVYEHASNRNLRNHVEKASLTWGKRLQICIDIASGLAFLHGGSVTGEVVIHRTIKSRNIFLDGDMRAKIAYFSFALILPADEKIDLKVFVGANAYCDPKYLSTGRVSKFSDIYSFGIVLFELLLRRPAFRKPLIKDLYKAGKLHDLVFEGATNDHIAPMSVAIFRRIAIQCIHDNPDQRPTASEVLIQLKQALEIQEKGINIAKVPFEDIKYATDNLSIEKFIGREGFGEVFKGELPGSNGLKVIAAKRMDRSLPGDADFYRELEILLKFKHKNVIALEGYCDEIGEKIIVCEYASEGSLDHWLDNISLTWMKRLMICIDVANGLDFLHGGVLRKEVVLHRDIKSSNILLSSEWRAKISDFRISLISPINQEIGHLIKMPAGSEGYIDPAHIDMTPLSKYADIYAFGVVLFEILCGRLAHPIGASQDKQQSLGPLAKKYYEQNKLDELVFEVIKEQIVPQSLSIFANTAYNCLHDDRDQRPTASDVVIQLKNALEFQEDHEMWESRLPSDYKDIIQQSRHPEFCVTEKKKYLYDMLLEGILIQEGKVWFWLDSGNRRNQMTSATLFTYKNQSSLKWRPMRKSRFERVALMTDTSNLMIETQIKPQFLTSNATYGVYLIFKLCGPNKKSSEPMYVNLNYKRGNQTLHAYFATRRDDGWMMIKLYQFLNHKDDSDFEVLLESFSRNSYCRTHRSIYVEGIEFRAIDDVTRKEIVESKEVQQSVRLTSNTRQVQQFSTEELELSENYDEGAKLVQPSEMNVKKPHVMFSAKETLYDSSNMKFFQLKPSEHSRHGVVIEVLSQQIIHIKCKFDNQMVYEDTRYRCHMVFKLSEKCRGLHCPVKVRNVLPQSNNDTKALYFRSPDPWNVHDIDRVPNHREDGWMEVNVWEFNSNDEVRNDHIHVNLKLICYEGTMSGLVVCGLEFRPL